MFGLFGLCPALRDADKHTQSLINLALGKGAKTEEVLQALSIPIWARKIKLSRHDIALFQSEDVRGIPSSIAAQSFRAASDRHSWFRAAARSTTRRWPLPVMTWALFNCTVVDDELTDYLSTLRDVDKKTTPDRMRARSEQWHHKQWTEANKGILSGEIDYKTDDLSISDGDYTLSILTKELEFAQESAAMRHCVRSYFSRAAYGQIVIGSIKKDGKRIATVEFSRVGEVKQIKGHCNAAPDRSVRKFAKSVSTAITERLTFPVAPPMSPYSVQVGRYYDNILQLAALNDQNLRAEAYRLRMQYENQILNGSNRIRGMIKMPRNPWVIGE